MRAQADAVADGEESLPMTRTLREKLSRVHDHWLLWNSAFHQNDRVVADEAVRDLATSLDDIDMAALPDIASGMVARAVDAARQGDTVRGAWVLDMAERLDPQRPEVAFARSRVNALAGDWPGAGVQYFEGWRRSFNDRLSRFLWFNNLLLLILAGIVLSGAAYVGVLFAARGGQLCRDIAQRLRGLGSTLAYAVAIAILAWPLAIPNGWIWIVLYWATLLWGHTSVAERVVLTTFCLVLALSPILVLRQQQSVEVAVSDQMRGLRGISGGRLYGRLLSDLAALRETLPESSAVTHVIADAHDSLGQDQIARPLYRELLEIEPTNAHALNNLGMYHVVRQEHFEAIRFFQQAAEVAPDWFVPHYNLAQSFRELLEFDDADIALGAARASNPSEVSRWVNESRQAQYSFGSFERQGEIRSQLVSAWLGRGSTFSQQLLAGAGVAPIVLFVPLVGWLIGRYLRSGRESDSAGTSDTFWDRMVLWLVPGLHWAEEQRGLRSAHGGRRPGLRVAGALDLADRLSHAVELRLRIDSGVDDLRCSGVALLSHSPPDPRSLNEVFQR